MFVQREIQTQRVTQEMDSSNSNIGGNVALNRMKFYWKNSYLAIKHFIL
jgi:hypothetical protein